MDAIPVECLMRMLACAVVSSVTEVRGVGVPAQMSDLRRALVGGEEPHTNVSGNDRLVGVVDKAGQTLHLLMNILLVLEDVGLTRQHGRAWVVVAGNVDDSQLSSVGKDAMSLGSDAAAGETGDFVKAVPGRKKKRRRQKNNWYEKYIFM